MATPRTSAKARERRSTAVALLLSLLFHGGGALVLSRLIPAGPPKAGHKPIEVELRIIPREASAPVRLPPAQPAPAKTAKAKANAASKASAQAAQQAASSPSAPQPGSRGVTAGNAIDAPRPGTSLEPRVSTVLPGIGNGEGDDARGHVVVNGPGEDGDPEVIAEYTREKVARKAGEMVDAALGDAAKASGTLPPYFSRLQNAMNEGVNKAEVELSDKTRKEKVADAADSWLLPAQSFGRTGSPFADPEDEKAVTDTGLGHIAERGGISGRDMTENRQNEAALQYLSGMQVMMNAAQRPRLKTVLEVRQTASGALAETVVLQKSGDPKFDEFVLHQTRKLITQEGDTDDGDSPWHDEKSDGFRSIWQFTWEPPTVKAKLIRVLRTPPRTFQGAE